VVTGGNAGQSAQRARVATRDSLVLPDSLHTTLYGTVVKIESMVDRDGPLFVHLDTGGDEPVRLVFGSLFTSPPPDADRLALYDRLRKLEVGDRIRADGYALAEGFLLQSVSRITDDPAASTLRLEGDEDWLLLGEQVPLGISYARLDRMLPGLGELKQEAGAGRDMRVATRPLEVMGYDAVLELNFTRDTLSSYYFNVWNVDEEDSRDLYRRLQGFYAERYGRFDERESSEHGYSSLTSIWKATDFTITLTRGIQHDFIRVSWGFQK
jgi:hypothetical protein